MLCHEVHGVLALDLMLLIPAGEESLGVPSAGTERLHVRDCVAECHGHWPARSGCSRLQ